MSKKYEYDMTQIRKGQTPIQMMGGWKKDAAPGLFVYHAFGTGNLYLDTEGSYVHCYTSDAGKYCDEHDLKYNFVDSFWGYQPVALGDR